MNYDEYFKIVASKVGAKNAFDLSRDARITALENLIVEKEIATKDEIEAEIEKELGESAKKIVNMPPIPIQKIDEENK